MEDSPSDYYGKLNQDVDGILNDNHALDQLQNSFHKTTQNEMQTLTMSSANRDPKYSGGLQSDASSDLDPTRKGNLQILQDLHELE